MKINDTRKKVRIQDINWGDVFEYENKIYVKTEYLFAELENENSVVNAIDLETGIGENIKKEIVITYLNKAEIKF